MIKNESYFVRTRNGDIAVVVEGSGHKTRGWRLCESAVGQPGKECHHFVNVFVLIQPLTTTPDKDRTCHDP
jgi:hypothetical protein